MRLTGTVALPSSISNGITSKQRCVQYGYLSQYGWHPPRKVEFLDRVQKILWHRRTIRTHGKHIEIAPRKSQAGDVICVFHGCPVPAVLRSIEKTIEFRFISECYVQYMG
jgi:hypothetical protein